MHKAESKWGHLKVQLGQFSTISDSNDVSSRK